MCFFRKALNSVASAGNFFPLLLISKNSRVIGGKRVMTEFGQKMD
jgi:hypothetical protein